MEGEKLVKKKVIHAAYQTRSHAMEFTHCGRDIDKVLHAGFQDMEGNYYRSTEDLDYLDVHNASPVLTGITCKLCLRKNHGATRSQPKR